MRKIFKGFDNFGNVLSVIAIIVSIISIIITNNINSKTNRLTERVNSKEYEMSENLKYEVLNIISDLRSIDAKAAIAPHIKEKEDYSIEINSLKTIQKSPEYLLFLKSITNDDDRLLMELRLRLLTTCDFSEQEYREWTHLILDALEEQVKLDAAVKQVLEDYSNNWNDLMKDLCEMKSISTVFNAEDVEKAKQERHELIKAFSEHLWLNLGINDPDVKYYYGFMSNNKELIEQAIDSGSNTKITDQEIIRRYQTEYEEFVKSYSDRN